MDNKLIFYNGPTSPFGRKVKIASLVQEINLEEKIINVYEADFLNKKNPLRKIPTLLVNNLAIVDSDNIWNMHRGNLHRTGYVNFTSGGGDMTVTVSNMADWNLLGLPMNVSNNSQMSVYPSSLEGTLFSFSDSYVQESDLTPGTGYWLRFDQSGETHITGPSVANLTISMQSDWNLISGISTAVQFTGIGDPDGIIIPGTLFGFGESYEQADALEPGKAYWLRTSGAGEIQLGSNRGAKVVPTLTGPQSASSITIKGLTLYFGQSIEEAERLSYGLPPKPPSPSADIRFSNDSRFCTSDECVIKITDTDRPLAIECDIQKGESWELVSGLENLDESILVSGQSQLTLVSNSEQYILRKSTPIDIPSEFSLYPAYPNPFNPVTTISYDIPNNSFVSLIIFDMVGKEIVQLINTNQEAGFKSVVWEGINKLGQSVGAGVYFYKIQVGEYYETNKIVYLK